MKQVVKKTLMLALLLLVIGLISGTMSTRACDQVEINPKKEAISQQEEPAQKGKGSLFPDLILGHSLFEI